MKILAAFVFPLCLAVSISAHAGNLDSYFKRIQESSWHDDIPKLTELSRELNEAAKGNDAEALYAAAYADYRLACAGLKDTARYSATINESLKRAEKTLGALKGRGSAYDAESLALLSTVYGMRIAMHPMLGPVLGLKSGAAIAQAEKLAPANPRVQLFKGTNLLYTPALFGGSRDGAIKAFDRAIDYLPENRYSPVNWGLDDAYMWRGIALKSAGRVIEAKASFERAVALSPEREWALKLLAGTGGAKQ